jgi:O-antigen ligase
VRHGAGSGVRGEAVRLAGRWRGAGLAVAGIAIVAILMTAFIVMDYTFDQDPHRVIKVGLGVLAIGVIMSRPRFGLLLLPVITPFLPWVPPTPVPGLNALNVLLFAIFGTYALGAVLSRRPIVRPGRLGGAIGILLGLAALSIIRGAVAPTGYGYEAYAATLGLFRSAMSFALYFILMAMVRGERDRRHIGWAVLVGLLLEAVVTMMLGRSGSGGRAVGSIGQSNELGGYLAVFSVIAAAIAVGARSWQAKLAAAGIFVAGSIGIMYSLSRGGMLALLGGLVVVAWRSSRWALGVLLLVLALSPFWLPDYVVERINSSKVESETGDEAQVDAASEARLLTWRAILEVVKHHPVDGVGFEGLGYVLPDVGAAMGLADVKDSAHNTYLRMLAELGVFGLLAFLWLMWSVWRLADDAVRGARNRFDRSLAVGLCGATVAMAVSCAFGDRFWSPVVVSSFWVMCAIVEDSLTPSAEAA